MICYTRDVAPAFGTSIKQQTVPHPELPKGRGPEKMKRILALIQIVIIILIVGFGTWQLYLGHFELALASFPFLIIYYVFIVAGRNRP
jgi:hypothetical protein